MENRGFDRVVLLTRFPLHLASVDQVRVSRCSETFLSTQHSCGCDCVPFQHVLGQPNALVLSFEEAFILFLTLDNDRFGVKARWLHPP